MPRRCSSSLRTFLVIGCRSARRRRSEFDPDQFDQFRIGMDHALDTMGDGRGIGGEKPRIEAPHPAGRGDGAGDQKQAGGVRQQPGFAERLPHAVEPGRHAIGLAAEAETGFLAGLADRRDSQRPGA